MGSKITCPTVESGDFVEEQPIYATFAIKGILFENDDKSKETLSFYTKNRQLVLDLMGLIRIFEIPAVANLNELENKPFSFKVDFNEANFIKFLNLMNGKPYVRIFYHNFDSFLVKTIFVQFNMETIANICLKTTCADFGEEKHQKNFQVDYGFYGNFYFDLLQCKIKDYDKKLQLEILKEILKYPGTSFKLCETDLGTDHVEWVTMNVIQNLPQVLNKLLDYSLENENIISDIVTTTNHLTNWNENNLSEQSLIPGSIEKILDLIEKKDDNSRTYANFLKVMCYFDQKTCENSRLKRLFFKQNLKFFQKSENNEKQLCKEFTNSDGILFSYLTKNIHNDRIQTLYYLIKNYEELRIFFVKNAEKVSNLFKDLTVYSEERKFQKTFMNLTIQYMVYLNKLLCFPDFSLLRFKAQDFLTMQYKTEDIQWPSMFASSKREVSENSSFATPCTEFLFHLVTEQNQISTLPTHFYIMNIDYCWKRIMIFSYEDENYVNIKDFEVFKGLTDDEFKNGNYPRNLSITLQVFFEKKAKKDKNPQFESYVSFPFNEPCKASSKLLVYFDLCTQYFFCSFGLLGVSSEENCRKYDVRRMNALALERVGFEFN